MRKFKLYPVDGDRRYYLVYLFRTKAQMWYHRRRIEARGHSVLGDFEELGNNFEACATWWGVRAVQVGDHHWPIASLSDPLCVGCIMLHVARSGPRFVSHEIMHAALYWAQRVYNGKFYDMVALGQGFKDWELKDVENDAQAEEELCTLVGDMNHAYWKGFWRHAEKWADLARA